MLQYELDEPKTDEIELHLVYEIQLPIDDAVENILVNLDEQVEADLLEEKVAPISIKAVLDDEDDELEVLVATILIRVVEIDDLDCIDIDEVVEVEIEIRVDDYELIDDEVDIISFDIQLRRQIVDDEVELDEVLIIDVIELELVEQQIYVIQQTEVSDLPPPLDEIVVMYVEQCVYIDLHLTEHLLLYLK